MENMNSPRCLLCGDHLDALQHKCIFFEETQPLIEAISSDDSINGDEESLVEAISSDEDEESLVEAISSDSEDSCDGYPISDTTL